MPRLIQDIEAQVNTGHRVLGTLNFLWILKHQKKVNNLAQKVEF